MTAFGPTNFQQSAQQRSQQLHREASQRAMEMHQQAAQSPQWLWEVHQRQHQRWLKNLKEGYWADQQHRKRQALGSLHTGAVQNQRPLRIGQRSGRVPATMQPQRRLARTDLKPTDLAPVEKERGGCARVVGGVLLLLLLGLCVSQVLIPLIM